MKDKINRLRELLHQELESDNIDYETILKMSQELDKLIVEYHKEEDINLFIWAFI